MPVCVKAIEQLDGSFLFGPDPSITDVSTCAYVVQTGAESVLGSLSDLSPSDALVISSAVGVVWAIAWGFKTVTRTVLSSWSSENEKD